MDELQAIRLIENVIGKPSQRISVGIGDDAAVVSPPKGHLVATADGLVEGVHFDSKTASPREIGYKALAVNLSDIAAMAAVPRYALVSLGLPRKAKEPFVRGIYEGMGELARGYHLDIIGGNIVRSERAFIDVTVLGEVGDKPLLRSGASPGELVVLTGFVGTSAAGLHALQRLGKKARSSHPLLVQAHLRPVPRIEEARLLRLCLTAGLDVSDGLSSELHHLARASGVGIEIEESHVPIHPAVRAYARSARRNAMDWALSGGEDYELLATLPEKRLPAAQRAVRRFSGNLIVIGQVVRGHGVRLRGEGRRMRSLPESGWRHL